MSTNGNQRDPEAWAVESDAIAIYDGFQDLVNNIHSYLLQNIDYLSSRNMQDRASRLMNRFLDLAEDYRQLFQVIVDEYEANPPFNIIELIDGNDPFISDPVCLIRYFDGKQSSTMVHQFRLRFPQPSITLDENFTIDASQDNNTTFRPFRVQFTPSRSSSGGPPRENVDSALQGEYYASAMTASRQVVCSEEYPRPTTRGWAGAGFGRWRRSRFANFDTPNNESASATPASSSTPAGRSDALPTAGAASTSQSSQSGSDSPAAIMTDSDPSHQEAHASTSRTLQRSGAFHDKSHPDVFWHDSWGEKPSNEDTETTEDGMPPWMQEELFRKAQSEAQADTGTETARTRDKGKGKARAVESYEAEAEAVLNNAPTARAPAPAPFAKRDKGKGKMRDVNSNGVHTSDAPETSAMMDKGKGKAKAVESDESQPVPHRVTVPNVLAPAKQAQGTIESTHPQISPDNFPTSKSHSLKKGKRKATTAETDESASTNPVIEPAEDSLPPARHVPRSRKEVGEINKGTSTGRSTSGRWVGLTKTLRSVAAAVSRAGGSREAHAEASSSSTSDPVRGPRGEKRRRGVDEDENLEEEKSSGRKKFKRGGRK